MPKSEKTIDKSQLLIYQIAAQEVFNEQPTLLTYHYVDGDKKFSFLGTDQDIEELKAKILATIGKIKKSDFQPTPSKFACGYCDYRDICEFRQS